MNSRLLRVGVALWKYPLQPCHSPMLLDLLVQHIYTTSKPGQLSLSLRRLKVSETSFSFFDTRYDNLTHKNCFLSSITSRTQHTDDGENGEVFNYSHSALFQFFLFRTSLIFAATRLEDYQLLAEDSITSYDLKFQQNHRLLTKCSSEVAYTLRLHLY